MKDRQIYIVNATHTINAISKKNVAFIMKRYNGSLVFTLSYKIIIKIELKKSFHDAKIIYQVMDKLYA